MGFRFRRTIQPKGPDRFVVNLGEQERAVIRAVCEDVASVLEDDDTNPLVKRLFPAGHASDPEVDRHYREMVHDDLLRSRREILARVAATAEDAELDRQTLESWMVGLNSVRLVLGTRLDVSEDDRPALDADDPDLPAWAVYEFLGAVVDAVVEALQGTFEG